MAHRWLPAEDPASARSPARRPASGRYDVPVRGAPMTRLALQLQRTAGNAATGRLLEDRQSPDADPSATDVQTGVFAFQATIARHHTGHRPWRPPATTGRLPTDHDAENDRGAEAGDVDAEQVTAAVLRAAPHVPEPEPGGTVVIPDMQTPPSLDIADHDTVSGRITYEPTITRSGVVDPFGATRWSSFTAAGIVVRSVPGAYTVTFRLQNPITYNVRSPKTSIASANDPALTNANYAPAATDLTPRMDVQNGKPRRRSFWAEDLTLRHERFHADERRRLNRAGAEQAQTWLSEQNANSAADVAALVAQIPARVIAASQAAVGTLDEKESRAYGDGAPLYQARADAIRAKGALGSGSGGYP